MSSEMGHYTISKPIHKLFARPKHAPFEARTIGLDRRSGPAAWYMMCVSYFFVVIAWNAHVLRIEKLK